MSLMFDSYGRWWTDAEKSEVLFHVEAQKVPLSNTLRPRQGAVNSEISAGTSSFLSADWDALNGF